MNTNKTILHAAIATALGFASPYATASYIEIGSPIKFATEVKVGDNKTVGMPADHALKLNMSAFAGRNVSDTSPLELRLSLTNGAKFNHASLAVAGILATDLSCNYTGAGGATTKNAANVLNGLADDVSVTFKLPDGNIAGTNPICALKSLHLKLQSGQKAYEMVATGYLKSNAEPVIVNTAGSIVDFTMAFGANVDSKVVTIDVTNPSLSQKFVDGKTVVELGLISYTAMTTPVYKPVDPAVAIGKGDVVDGLKAVLSGSSLSVPDAKVHVILGSDGAKCAGTVKTTVTAAASGVTFNFVAADLAEANKGLLFCYEVSGTNRIEKGKISLDLSATGGVDATPNVTITDGTLATVVKNGASFKVLNIPNSTSTTDKAFIRIYNFSTGKASIYGTLYEQGNGTGPGKELGRGKTLTEIDAGAVKVLEAKTLETIFGVSWSGRAWLQIEGDSQQIRAQVLVRSGGAGGALINLSDRILEDSGAICRSGTVCK